MALSLFSRKNRTINMIINDYSISLIEMKSSNPPIVHRFEERFFPFGIVRDGKIIEHETLATILEECVLDWKIQKRSIRFIVPDSYVIIRKVTIPTDVKDDEIEGYLYLELGSSIHLPFDEPVFATYPLSKGKENREVLLFAAQQEIVLEYADLLSDAKLKPEAADLAPLALYRLYHHLGTNEKDERLLMVQFDINVVNICIFENHLPFFLHHLLPDFDEEKWNVSINKAGKQDLIYQGETDDLLFQIEDIYKEINKYMDFYRYSINHGKQQVTKILLNGDHPYLDLITKEMERRFSVPVQKINVNLIAQATEDKLPRTHYLSLGLALKEV